MTTKKTAILLHTLEPIYQCVRNHTLEDIATIFRCVLQNYEKRLLYLSCLSVRPSFHPHGTTRLPMERFSRNL